MKKVFVFKNDDQEYTPYFSVICTKAKNKQGVEHWVRSQVLFESRTYEEALNKPLIWWDDQVEKERSKQERLRLSAEARRKLK